MWSNTPNRKLRRTIKINYYEYGKRSACCNKIGNLEVQYSWDHRRCATRSERQDNAEDLILKESR